MFTFVRGLEHHSVLSVEVIVVDLAQDVTITFTFKSTIDNALLRTLREISPRLNQISILGKLSLLLSCYIHNQVFNEEYFMVVCPLIVMRENTETSESRI